MIFIRVSQLSPVLVTGPKLSLMSVLGTLSSVHVREIVGVHNTTAEKVRKIFVNISNEYSVLVVYMNMVYVCSRWHV